MIFYGRYNEQTEYGRAIKARCMNCLQEGHMSDYCRGKVMCPHCAEKHQADKCSLKRVITTSCTACTRYLELKDPKLNLEELFSKTPTGPRHSPLDPKCPTHIARRKVKKSSLIESGGCKCGRTHPDTSTR